MKEIEKGELVGTVTHYYNKIGVAVLDLVDTLEQGDNVRIVKGTKINFTQAVESMEIEHKKIEKAKPGDDVALKVDQMVCRGCKIYRV